MIVVNADRPGAKENLRYWFILLMINTGLMVRSIMSGQVLFFWVETVLSLALLGLTARDTYRYLRSTPTAP